MKQTIGTKLFVSCMLAAFIGLSAASLFFYRVLHNRAKEQISTIIDKEAISIQKAINPVNQTLRTLARTIEFMHDKAIHSPDDYIKLLVKVFRERPPVVMGLAMQQSPHSLATGSEYFSPYLYADKRMKSAVAQPLPAPDDDIYFMDLSVTDNAPNQTYYKVPMQARRPVWLDPYVCLGILMVTENIPLYHNQKMLGFVAMDLNLTDIAEAVSRSVLSGEGHFFLVAQDDRIVSFPSDPLLIGSTIENDSDLSNLLQQIRHAGTAPIRLQGKYWSSRQISGSNWRLYAEVPQAVVLVPVIMSSLGGAAGAFLVMALCIWLFVRSLNRRLDPIIAQCNSIVTSDQARHIALERVDSELFHSAEMAEKGDELDLVQHSVKTMSEQLKKSVQFLEKNVEERTKDLQAAKQAAEAASRAKSSFMAGISHELRTPLNGIMGYTQILRESDALDAATKKGIDTIFTCGGHLAKLVDELLDIARIEAGKVTLSVSSITLVPMLHEVISVIQPQANDKNIAISLQISPNVPTNIKTDNLRLKQILINLISNAVKFTNEGEVVIRAQCASPTPETDTPPAASLMLSVQDSGVGMTPEQLSRLFTPFERFSLSGKTTQQGTGLGMAISKGIVTALGGSIQVSSEVAVGTCVTIILPI
jgi:signal transduction histidine kinase